MNIGLIQPNAVAGDFSRNVRALIEHYRNCLDLGADIVIAPPDSLCGPGLGDLVYRSGFQRQNLAALDYLSTELGTAPLVLGTQWPHLLEDGTGYYDKAVCAVTSDGSDQENSVIRSLEDNVINVKGISIAVVRPGEALPSAGGRYDLVLAVPSGPWHAGQFEENLENDSALARTFHCSVVRASLAGGQERNLYGGGSTVVGADGRLLKRLALFSEDSGVVDPESSGTDLNLPSAIEQIRTALVMGIRDFVIKSGFDSVCLGLSGGIDSALVAALAVEALGPEHVHGLAMPGPYSSQGSLDDAYALARNLGITCQTVGITPAFDALKESMINVFAGMSEDLTEENMQARIRGVILMAFSNKFNHLVLSTGNKSEASVGFCTMYGDTCGALLPIGDLYKTEVYALSRHLNATNTVGERIPASTIDKAPSAELRPGQVDQDSLPPYDVLDAILRRLVDDNMSATDVIEEGTFDEATVRKVQRLLKTSEWKRGQAPPILAVTPFAYGPGRTIPAIHKLND